MPGLTDEDKALLSDDEQAVLESFARQEDEAHDSVRPGDGVSELEPTGEEPPQQPAEQEAPQEPGDGAPSDDDYVDIETVRLGGRDVPVEDLQALIEFQQWANSNPDKMQAFGQYLNGQADFVIRDQQTPAPQPEEQVDWDLVDPQFKKAFDAQQAQLQEMRKQFDDLRNPIQAWQTQQQEQVQREALDQIAKATDRVQEKFGLSLTEQEVEDLHNQTAQLNILPGLRQSIPDGVEAVATALEMTLFRSPQFQDKIVSTQVASERAKDKRDLAGKVGGSGGSERSGIVQGQEAVDPRKMSKEDRQRAMAAEIAESMRGTT